MWNASVTPTADVMAVPNFLQPRKQPASRPIGWLANSQHPSHHPTLYTPPHMHMQNSPPTNLPLTPSITHTSVQSMLAARPLVPQHCRGRQGLDHQTTRAIQPRPTLPTRVHELATPHPPQTRASALSSAMVGPVPPGPSANNPAHVYACPLQLLQSS